MTRLLIWLLMAAMTMVASQRVQAQDAQPAPPEVAPCFVVNTFETIKVARCYPENGQPYLLNNMGFMFPEGS